MLIVCDIDGVLTQINDELRGTLNNDDLYYSKLHSSRIIGAVKNLRSGLVFLTGRYEKHRKVTKEWLETHGFYVGELIMYPDDKPKSSCHAEEVIEYKADILNLLHADFYIEDNKEVVEKLKQLCPNTIIMWVSEE